MKALQLKDILTAIKGNIELKQVDDITIKNVTTKPWKVKDHSLFFQFKNRQIADWIKHYPVVLVTDQPIDVSEHDNNSLIIVQVKNINKAYWDFVNYYRSLFKIPVIGVTGTCGKTTATEMMKSILDLQFEVVKGNYNGKNALSLVSGYLFDIDDKTDAAVFEMGVAAPGDLSFACKHFQPQVRVILNVGTYHLKYCKTQDNYLKAKTEILEGMSAEDILILNADDENVRKINLDNIKGKIIYFGVKDGVQYQAKNIRHAMDGIVFTFRHQYEEYPVFVPGFGTHNAYNALAALAACHQVGIDFRTAIKGLASYKPCAKHLEFRTGLNGCTVIDDSWNCTPPSMESALKILRDFAGGRKTIAVLGKMPQLGEAGLNEYVRMGECVSKLAPDLLFIAGSEAELIGNSAVNFGFDRQKMCFCKDGDDLCEALYPHLDENAIVLLKIPYQYVLKQEASFRRFMTKLFE